MRWKQTPATARAAYGLGKYMGKLRKEEYIWTEAEYLDSIDHPFSIDVKNGRLNIEQQASGDQGFLGSEPYYMPEVNTASGLEEYPLPDEVLEEIEKTNKYRESKYDTSYEMKIRAYVGIEFEKRYGQKLYEFLPDLNNSTR